MNADRHAALQGLAHRLWEAEGRPPGQADLYRKKAEQILGAAGGEEPDFVASPSGVVTPVHEAQTTDLPADRAL